MGSMSPIVTAQALVVLFALAVLLACSAIFAWVGNTVLPDVFETGAQFGIPPSRGELFLQKTLKAMSLLFRLVIVVILAWVAYQAFGVK